MNSDETIRNKIYLDTRSLKKLLNQPTQSQLLTLSLLEQALLKQTAVWQGQDLSLEDIKLSQSETAQKIENLKADIIQKSKELEAAQLKKSQQMDYDQISRNCLKFPSRYESESYIFNTNSLKG